MISKSKLNEPEVLDKLKAAIVQALTIIFHNRMIVKIMSGSITSERTESSQTIELRMSIYLNEKTEPSDPEAKSES